VKQNVLSYSTKKADARIRFQVTMYESYGQAQSSSLSSSFFVFFSLSVGQIFLKETTGPNPES